MTEASEEEQKCVFVCGRKGWGALWGRRQHPAVPSNGRIEVNRVEKGLEAVNSQTVILNSPVLSLCHLLSFLHSLSLLLLGTFPICSWLLPLPAYLTCCLPPLTFSPAPLPRLPSCSLSSSHPFILPFIPASILTPFFPPPPFPSLLPSSVSPWRRCNDSYLSVIRGPL